MSLPILGVFAVVSFISSFLFSLAYGKKHIIKDYEKAIKKKDKKLEILENLKRFDTYKKDTISNRLDLISYKEILQFGTRQDKINLIGLLSYTPNRHNVALIAKALKDNDETVRILASTAIQKMDDFFHSQISFLQKRIKNSDDFALSYFELAKTYDDYIYSGLVPEEGIAGYNEKMLLCYKKAFSELSSNNEIIYNYLRALIRCNEIEKANNVLNVYINSGASVESYKFWQAEIEFLEKNYKKSAQILNSIDTENIKNERLFKSCYWWQDGK